MAVQLSSLQETAVSRITDWYGEKEQQVFYLAGYAGTGKSTLTNEAIARLKDKCNVQEVASGTYTGKAASVLRRKGVKGAKTIHSLCYKLKEDNIHTPVFMVDPEGEAAEADLILLDECSMVDEQMAADIMSFGKKILVLGDPGQLPPVGGAGAFTKREPDLFLHEVHRQAAESPILELATMAREGRPLPEGYDRGGVRVLPLTTETQQLVYSEQTQPICGLNRVRWTYNRRIRARRGFDGQEPMPGERIICCKNNRNLHLFNGALGTLKQIYTGYKFAEGAYKIDVQLDDEREEHKDLEIDPYHFDNHFTGGQSKKFDRGRRYEEFDWGYVLTCHKAQGSSWDHVTVVDDSASFRDNRANWLYTAITRAETGLTILTRQ